MRWRKLHVRIPIYIPTKLIEIYMIKKHDHKRCDSCDRLTYPNDRYCGSCGALIPK